MSSMSTGLSDHERKGGRRRGLAAKWDDRDAFSIEEAGEILGLGRASAYKAANEGTIPTIEIGRRKIVPRRGLERLLGIDDDVPAGGQQLGPQVVAAPAAPPTPAPQRLELAIEVSTPRRGSGRSRKHMQTVEVISPPSDGDQ